MDSKTEVWARKRSEQRETIVESLRKLLVRYGVEAIRPIDLNDEAYRIINALERAGWRIVAQPGKDK